jgi:hypothetical protein
MGIVTILFFSASMAYVGWMFGVAQQIEASEKSISEAYKEGYIKGCKDCHCYFIEKRDSYYNDVIIK